MLSQMARFYVILFYITQQYPIVCIYIPQILCFFKNFLFNFRERGKEGEREGEKQQCVVAPPMPHTGDLTCNPGMCPDWESNRRPFGSQAGTQSTEPHQPGLYHSFFNHSSLEGMDTYIASASWLL